MNRQPEHADAELAASSESGGSRLDPRLFGLNLALLAVLAVFCVRSAPGQQGNPGGGGANQPARGRGEYTLISGRIQGGSTHAVYILDAANHELMVLGWDRSKNHLEPIGHRNLADDAEFFQGTR